MFISPPNYSSKFDLIFLRNTSQAINLASYIIIISKIDARRLKLLNTCRFIIFWLHLWILFFNDTVFIEFKNYQSIPKWIRISYLSVCGINFFQQIVANGANNNNYSSIIVIGFLLFKSLSYRIIVIFKQVIQFNKTHKLRSLFRLLNCCGLVLSSQIAYGWILFTNRNT